MSNSLKKSVVHLEGAADSQDPIKQFYDEIKQRDEPKGAESSQLPMSRQFLRTSRDVRVFGTATFLEHNDRRYLLTARHVVFDERGAQHEIDRAKEFVERWPAERQAEMMKSMIASALGRVFNIVFRVRSLDEHMAAHMSQPQEFLMNLNAGAPSTVPFTLSSPDLDLAIISLDQRDRRFADDLIASGYTPINFANVADGPSFEGEEVLTVGYPASVSILGQTNADNHWGSNYVSLPAFTFGRVSMLSDHLPFFWADMSIYPGNSGGPVFSGEKIVGIVSAQAKQPIEGGAVTNPELSKLTTRIPFAKIIKSRFVKDLLDKQIAKDEYSRPR